MSGSIRLGEVIELNPRLQLAKNADGPHIEMADLEPGRLTVHSSRRRPYRGGARFQNHDVLLARITPCLENGKIAEVVGLSDGEVGHGSTEFIVLRARPGGTHPSFVRYFAAHPDFRAYAIANMNGSSGRQRVPAEAIAKFEFPFPSLDDQQRIAEILESLDEKMRSNVATARALVDWLAADFKMRATSLRRVDSVFSMGRGLSYSGAMLVDEGVPMLNLANFGTDGWLKDDGFKFVNVTPPEIRLAKPGDLLIANTDLTQDRRIVGRAVLMPRLDSEEVMTFSHHVYRAIPVGGAVDGAELLGFLAMSQPRYVDRMRACATGTTVAAVNARDILAYEMDWPEDDAAAAIVARAREALEFAWSLARESRQLARQRDDLLPGLISGRYQLADVE